jgi:hypothetical protein
MTGPATRMPPENCPCGWLGAATWTVPSKYCALPPTQAAQQLGNLLTKRGDPDALRARAGRRRGGSREGPGEVRQVRNDEEWTP